MSNRRSNSFHHDNWDGRHDDRGRDHYRRSNNSRSYSTPYRFRGEERGVNRYRRHSSRENYRDVNYEPRRHERDDRRYYNSHDRHDRDDYYGDRYFADFSGRRNERNQNDNNYNQLPARPNHNNRAFVARDDKPPWLNTQMSVRDSLRSHNMCPTELIVQLLQRWPHFYHMKTDRKFSKAQVNAVGMRYILYSLNLRNKESHYYQQVLRSLQSFSGSNLFLNHALDHGGFPGALAELNDEARRLRLAITSNKERDLCPILPSVAP